MNFFQKTLLAALPCIVLTAAPSAANASNELTGYFNNYQTTNESVMLPTSTAGSSKVDSLIAKAKNFIGLPYRWGGTSPVSGFDCSGFMQYVYKATANINLPRTSGTMAQVGERISRDALKPGDMVFFAHSGGSRISHVGMYIGEGRFIHAPSTGKSIQITSLSTGYWANKFVTARRVLEA